MNQQSKMDSLMEIICNSLLGWAIYTPANFVLIPLVTGEAATLTASFGLSILYTFIAIARGYAVRRAFNGKSPWGWLKGRFA